MLAGGANEGLVVLELVVVGGGGPIEVLLEATVVCEPILCLDLGAAVGPVAAAGRLAVVGGVFVLDVDVLETPLLPSCLVGLLVGLLKPLKAALAAGVGLAVPNTALPRLLGATSCFLSPFTPACRLEGRDLGAAAVAGAFVCFGLA